MSTHNSKRIHSECEHCSTGRGDAKTCDAANGMTISESYVSRESAIALLLGLDEISLETKTMVANARRCVTYPLQNTTGRAVWGDNPNEPLHRGNHVRRKTCSTMAWVAGPILSPGSVQKDPPVSHLTRLQIAALLAGSSMRRAFPQEPACHRLRNETECI